MFIRRFRFIFFFLLITQYSTAQDSVKCINSYEELIDVYTKMVENETEITIWGHYVDMTTWDKEYFYYCPGFDHILFRKITSMLAFKLFHNYETMKQPVKEPKVVLSQLKEGDLIKCKVRLFKSCKFPKDDMLFLIEEIY